MLLKKRFSPFIFVLFFLNPIMYSMKIKQQNVRIDKALYLPPTLKKICFLNLIQHNKDTKKSNIPQELKMAAEALQRIHRKRFTADDLEVGFYACAHQKLKKKVDRINERKLINYDATPVYYDNQRAIPELPIFEGLAWMLEKYCQNTLDKGLIQLSRFAYWKKRKVCMAIVLSLGANVNYFGTVHGRIRSTTPLVTATIYKRFPTVAMLLNNKAVVNQPANDGYTPYALANNFADQSIATLLLERGAEDLPNEKNFDVCHSSMIDSITRIFNNENNHTLEGFSCVLQ